MTATNETIALITGNQHQSCMVENIDFAQRGFPEYRDHFALLIHDAFTVEECAALLEGAQKANDHRWDQAMVDGGVEQQDLDTNIRNSERIIWNNTAVAEAIFDRVKPHLPDDIRILHGKPHITGNQPVVRRETWHVSRLNERLRFLRYTKGMFFKPHLDASYLATDNTEMSWVTLHLYLNGGEDPAQFANARGNANRELVGGATRFWNINCTSGLNVNPKAGSVLIFQQRNLIHSGEGILQGTKLTLRSDILYRKVACECADASAHEPTTSVLL